MLERPAPYCFFIVLLTCFFQTNWMNAQNYRSTTVAGFINRDGPNDESMTLILTKTLVYNLTKLPGSVVTFYSDTEQYALSNGLWNSANGFSDRALRMARHFGTSQVILGFYRNDRKTGQIVIGASVYDVASGKEILRGDFRGDNTVSLFDAIDDMSLRIGGLMIGKDRALGSLTVTVENTPDVYSVRIAGREAGQVSAKKPFEANLIAGVGTDVEIRATRTGHTVKKVNVVLQDGERKTVTHAGSGALLIRDFHGTYDITLSGKTVTNSGKQADILLDFLTPAEDTVIQLQSGHKPVYRGIVNIRDGEIAKIYAPRLLKYHLTSPLWNLALPGWTQLCAGDILPGTVITAGASVSAVVTLVSLVMMNYCREQAFFSSENPDLQSQADRSAALWQTAAISGAAAYSGVLLFSIFHALFQPPEQWKYLQENVTVGINGTFHSMAFSVRYTF